MKLILNNPEIFDDVIEASLTHNGLNGVRLSVQTANKIEDTDFDNTEEAIGHFANEFGIAADWRPPRTDPSEDIKAILANPELRSLIYALENNSKMSVMTSVMSKEYHDASNDCCCPELPYDLMMKYNIDYSDGLFAFLAYFNALQDLKRKTSAVSITEHMTQTIEHLDTLLETTDIYTDQQKEEMKTAQQYLMHCFGRQDIRHQEEKKQGVFYNPDLRVCGHCNEAAHLCECATSKDEEE